MGEFVIGLAGYITTVWSFVGTMLEHPGVYGMDADAPGHYAIAEGTPGHSLVLDTLD